MEHKNETAVGAGRKPHRYSTPVLMAKGATQCGLADKRMHSIAGIVYMTGASRASIYDWMAKGLFPKPVKLGPRRVAWTDSDLNTWFAERKAA